MTGQEQPAVQNYTPPAASSSHYTAQHSNIAQHTRSSTSTKTNSCQNKELSKHIHSVVLK